MDSINKNQPEENHEELRGQKVVGKIKELVEKAQARQDEDQGTLGADLDDSSEGTLRV